MSNTTLLREVQEQIASLTTTVTALTALVTPGEPAKRTRTTRKATTTRKRVKKTRTSAKVQAKGNQVVGKDGLTRKEWNDTFSAKCRLAGKNAKGKSYYSLYVQDTKVWASVAESRVAGLTPNQVFAALKG